MILAMAGLVAAIMARENEESTVWLWRCGRVPLVLRCCNDWVVLLCSALLSTAEVVGNGTVWPIGTKGSAIETEVVDSYPELMSGWIGSGAYESIAG